VPEPLIVLPDACVFLFARDEELCGKGAAHEPRDFYLMPRAEPDVLFFPVTALRPISPQALAMRLPLGWAAIAERQLGYASVPVDQRISIILDVADADRMEEEEWRVHVTTKRGLHEVRIKTAEPGTPYRSRASFSLPRAASSTSTTKTETDLTSDVQTST
jgi:hypothetical protein